MALMELPAAHIPVMGMPTLRVRERQPMAEIGKLAGLPRSQSHVPMIGHEAIGEQPHAGNVLEGELQNAEIRLVVRVFEKTTRSSVGAIEHVIYASALIDA
ncbi:MAG: hypothetical protein U0744_07730 [Gemmataceae bacterium]